MAAGKNTVGLKPKEFIPFRCRRAGLGTTTGITRPADTLVE